MFRLPQTAREGTAWPMQLSHKNGESGSSTLLGGKKIGGRSPILHPAAASIPHLCSGCRFLEPVI